MLLRTLEVAQMPGVLVMNFRDRPSSESFGSLPAEYRP
jgi:hypothetical protein